MVKTYFYKIMIRFNFLFFVCLLSFSMYGQSISPFIHVDQFGYLPNSDKVAVLSNPQVGYNSNLVYTPSAVLEIRNSTTNAMVLEIAPQTWNNGDTHDASGDQGWWLDFTELTQVGTYYIIDVPNNERSSSFTISEATYTNVMKAAGRMFYYNRCNLEKAEPFAQGWTDGTNFNNSLQDYNTRDIDDPNNSDLEKDLSGGWFDAGDYNKYVTFASPALHDLLWAYEENPDAFGDDWNLPESNNGVSDLLDEIKWELDWLLKMNNTDGSTHIKMGSQNFNENIASPPSANTDQRFYGPTCSAASIAVAGVFAHAAMVYGTIDGYEDYSQILEQRAVTSYQYAKTFIDTNTLQTNCDDGSIVAGDADRTINEQKNEFLVAAVHLFALTDNEDYNTYIVDNALSTSPIVDEFWGVDTIMVNDALLLYTTLPDANVAISTSITGSIATRVANNYNGFFGFNGDDLYRAFMPEWSYHWGSNSPKAAYGNLNQLIVKRNVAPAQNEDFNRYIDEAIHYFHGVNPQGIVYLSNMYSHGAGRSVNEIYHTWFADGTEYDNALTSAIGPAPGFLAGGPNRNFTIETLSPPFGQPDQKSYLDFNDGYPNNSWEISEPAIYYQAAYIRLLANRVDAEQLLAVASVNAVTSVFNVYPNPAETIITIPELTSGDAVAIFTSEMRKIEDLSFLDTNEIDVSSYASGLYFLRIISKKGTGFLRLLIK